MGCKYTIRFMRNGTCDYQFDRQTNNIFRALWYLLTLSIKYPIVDFEIRRGYIACEKCDADWCERSPMCDACKKRATDEATR
jgi:hypothetical protein